MDIKPIRGLGLDPANTGHSPKAVSMLAHRLWRWPNIETALGECPVFAGVFAEVCSGAGTMPYSYFEWL